MLAAVRDQPEPVTVAALVTLTRLHENTLREHLDALIRAGLVSRVRTEPAGRGRPAWLYEGTTADPATSTEYAALAAALARSIAAHSDDPVTLAAESGESWGRRLAQDRGASPVPAVEARERLVELMDDLGFSPRTDERDCSQVLLTRCPILEAAARHKDVVCAAHLGLARGVLAEHGADPSATRLLPFSEPGACRLVLPVP